MSNYALVHHKDPILTNKNIPLVNEVDENIRQLLDNMIEVMCKENGIGLAANQIGIEKQMFVLSEGEYNQEGNQYFVNPKIIWESIEYETKEEACLSFPGISVPVKRPVEIKLSFLDYNGDRKEIHAKGLLARACQHEIDHISGKRIIDHVSRLKREMLINKIQNNK